MFSSLRRYAKVPGEEISDAFEMLLNEQVEPVRFSSGITEKHYTAKSDVHNAVTGLTRAVLFTTSLLTISWMIQALTYSESIGKSYDL